MSFVQVIKVMDMDEDPTQLVGPRPAAVRGEEQRRASADAEEFRRQSTFRAKEAPHQSTAKRAQAKAAHTIIRSYTR